MKPLLRNNLLPVLLLTILGGSMLFYRLSELPSLWFDEGWTLTVARNWVETGQYARLLLSNPVAAFGMAKPFSVTGLIALSFSFFGVGIWQGRLPAIISMLLASFMSFQLARKLYNPTVAYVTLFVLFFLAPPSIHPWIIGRQALAEPYMVFYLLVGYLFLLLLLEGKNLAIIGTAIFWGLALDSKGHVLPFLMVSLLAPLMLTFLRKEWRLFKLFALALVASFPVYFLLNEIQDVLFNPYPIYDAPVNGFITLGMIVLTPEVRMYTLKNIIIIGIPTVVGILYAINRAWCQIRHPITDPRTYYVRLSLLFLVISWFSWFTLLSLGWSRYFFPIWFIGSIFIARWLEKYLTKFHKLISGEFKQDFFTRIKIYLVILFVCIVVGENYIGMRIQFVNANTSLFQVTQYIKQYLGSFVPIETTECELLFMLDNPIHFPPDQVTVDLNRRIFLGENIRINYNLSLVKYDYLIDGPISKMWQLYLPLLAQGHFKILFSAGDYDVYKKLP